MKEILGVNAIPLTDKYLGSPLFTNRSKIACFEPLLTNLRTRMSGWDGTNLNNAGKTVMIKNVTSSVYMYQMNCFKIPVKICNQITKLQRNFWSGKNEKGLNENGKKWVCLKNWSSICKSLEEGG